MTQEYWEGLIGSTIEGTYLLGRLIGYTDQSAVYLTLYGEESAALKLRVPERKTPEVPDLNHPQIIRLFASGRCDLSGAVYDYFVTEVADENLATVVAARALSTDEARGMLGPILEGLGYLHDRGLAHGQIKPSNVLACGDSVKLSVDSVRTAGAAVSQEDDVRAIGLLIIEVLTRERQPSSIVRIPQPFRDIVEHSLQVDPALRWTARQAEMRLSGAIPSVPEAPVAAVPVANEVTKARPFPLWVYLAAAAAILVGVWFGLARSGSTSASSSAPLPPPVVVPVHRPTPAPEQSPKPTPFERNVAAAPPAPKSVTKPSAQGWFVVVASYTREQDAQKEARDLALRFTQFKPSVFPPSAIDTHYLVIIGSGLSADGAESLRQRAVGSGLPPDTYIKKYPAGR